MKLRGVGRRVASGVAGLLFRGLLRLGPLHDAELMGEVEDEASLEARRPEWNAAAEQYFRSRVPYAEQDSRKPWMPDASTPRLVAKLGWILSELVYGEKLIVLDFGCGLGWLSRLLNRLEFNVIGLDVSKTALDYAARAAELPPHDVSPHFQHYLTYDGGAFPLADTSVHFIISHDSFHHIPNQQDVLGEMQRVLVPGGRLILSEPGLGHASDPATADDTALYGVLEREVRIPDFEAKALRAGFREVYLKPCSVHTGEKWSRRRYWGFFRGVVRPEGFFSLRRSMISNPMFVCEKEGELRDSFHHRARLEVRRGGLQALPGEELTIPVVLRNSGGLTLSSRRHPRGGFITLSLRVFEEGSDSGLEPGGRFHLEHDLVPGAAVEVCLRLTAPQRSGRYRLSVEPVYEGGYWFSEKGTIPTEISLTVS